MRRTYLFQGSMDEARARVDDAMARQARRFPRFHPSYHWIGPYRARATFHLPFLNRDHAVDLTIRRDRILVQSRLPRLLNAFVPRIFAVLDRHARATLDGMLRGAI
jgi:hypothetical protein